MQVFKYIADNNTDSALEFCEQNGYYNIYSPSDLANTLRKIFVVGEEKAKEVLSLHPDKSVILEIFEVKPKEIVTEPIVVQRSIPYEQPTCPCYRNADGTNPTNIANQTNTYILLGALIISVAIISLKTNK